MFLPLRFQALRLQHNISNIISTVIEIINEIVNCETNGNRFYSCACGDWLEEIINPIGHNYVIDSIYEPQCIYEGWTNFICEHCGDRYVGDYVPALGHDYTKEYTPATCTQKGWTNYTCKRCDDRYVDDYIPTLGHDYTKEHIPATCIQVGKLYFECCRCGYNYTEENEPKTDHNWGDWKIVEQSTLRKEGRKERNCKICSASQSERIPRLSITQEEISNDINEIIKYTNIEREKNGLSKLAVRQDLKDFAIARANEASENYTHQRPNGIYAAQWIYENLPCSWAGENLLYSSTYITPKGTVEKWMASDGHRENSLNSKYKYIGIGIKMSDNGSYYYSMVLCG